MSAFDVWVVRFEPGDTPPAVRLQKAFGIDASSAAELERSLPRVVKHGVPAKTAGEVRQALEAIGAVVECKPARSAKSGTAGRTRPAPRAPGAQPSMPARVSAIDPAARGQGAGKARISVDNPSTASSRASDLPEEDDDPRHKIGASLLAVSRAQQRRIFLIRAIGAMAAGILILGLDLLMGNSVLRGEANWAGVLFDGMGLYLLGVGVYELVSELRG
jgi:hypothetical protein